MTNPTTYTARLLDFRKESDMKVTALYERLSKGDERQSKDEDSNSIQNQKAQLEEYAKQNGFVISSTIQTMTNRGGSLTVTATRR